VDDAQAVGAVGTVAALWRYPVKSMQGEELESAEITAGGTVGDRAFAVVDAETGKVASAKHPRKWARLLECEASFAERPVAGAPLPAVRIALPDGSVLRSDEPSVDEALSSMLGRRVTLASIAPDDRTLEEYWPDIDGLAPTEFIEQTTIADEQPGETVSDIPMGLAAPKGMFYDLAVLHLLTTGTLNALQGLYPEGSFHVRRYRPNVMVETVEDGFVENHWPGRTLGIGKDLQSVVSLPTMRCVMTTLAQRDLPKDLGLLRAVARYNRVEIPGFGVWACAGAYAGVTTPGTARVGDPVTLLPPEARR
jgi:uncharacterized protein YcbX